MTKKVFKAFSGSHALHTNHAKAMEKLATTLTWPEISTLQFLLSLTKSPKYVNWHIKKSNGKQAWHAA